MQTIFFARYSGAQAPTPRQVFIKCEELEHSSSTKTVPPEVIQPTAGTTTTKDKYSKATETKINIIILKNFFLTTSFSHPNTHCINITQNLDKTKGK